MQADRSAESARLAGSVRGLGVCDALHVELAACQHAALVAELGRRAASLDQAVRARAAAVRARPASGPRRRRSAPAADAAELARRRSAPTADAEPDPELARLRADARVLARVRATLPAHAPNAFVLTAPAGLALELVAACLHAAVAALGAGLGEGAAHAAASTGRFEATAAWIQTALDCRAVEAFCFEPGVDPARASS